MGQARRAPVSARLALLPHAGRGGEHPAPVEPAQPQQRQHLVEPPRRVVVQLARMAVVEAARAQLHAQPRSEEHTSELQSLMRNSYAVFCLKKKTQTLTGTNTLQRVITSQ